MSDLIDFVNMENAKNKVLTIAKEMLGVEEPISEEMLDEMSFQALTFIQDMETLVERNDPDIMFIIADLFVANIITSSIMFNKLQNVIAAYKTLELKHKELKEKCGE